MFFDGDFAPDDEKATFGTDGSLVSVVVDSASKQLLEGATLDYKDGLNQAGFTITNPNATAPAVAAPASADAAAADAASGQKRVEPLVELA